MSKLPIETIRHSLAHVMAAAVKNVFPKVKFGIGPVIENGFYYDFDLDQKLSEDHFKEIKKRMIKIISQNIPIEKEFVSIDKAIKKEKVLGQKYKVELLKEIKSGKRAAPESDVEKVKGGKISYYKIGDFRDLCKGPHVKNTKELPIDGFKLIKIAGAYWKGDEKNPQLQRIYAVAFKTKKELNEHLELLKEAKKRDHRKLGKELDLFTFSDLVGPGLPLWTPKGTMLRNLLDDFVWELRKERGYQMVDIPHITKKDLYVKSGHWDKFGDGLFKIKTREGHIFALKPMNCPHHIQIFDRHPRSYRDLPVRYANTTKVYRDEQTGELQGLTRVRSITQDDAHVFCRKESIKEEFLKIWDIIDKFYSAVGFKKLDVRLSFHDPKQMKQYLGTPKIWREAENSLKSIAKERGIKAEQIIGEAAFYGPKVDFIAKDTLGREWQIATIQLDLNLPERFDLTFTNENGKKEKIFIIHAAIMGSIERLLAILIEHYGGAFPVWLSPVQTSVIPISEKHYSYAKKVWESLKKSGIRAELNDSNDTLGKRVRESEMQKVPYILVVGEKEIKEKSVAVRQRSTKDIKVMKIDTFIKKIKKESEDRK